MSIFSVTIFYDKNSYGMLTWRNFYKELGVDIGREIEYSANIIVLSYVPMEELVGFLSKNGFIFNTTESFVNKLKFKSLYSIWVRDVNEEIKGTKKPFTLFEVLVYIASRIYFLNITALSFEDFRIYTSDDYDVSLIQRTAVDGNLEKSLVIGRRNIFVDQCWVSEFRFNCINTT